MQLKGCQLPISNCKRWTQIQETEVRAAEKGFISWKCVQKQKQQSTEQNKINEKTLTRTGEG